MTSNVTERRRLLSRIDLRTRRSKKYFSAYRLFQLFLLSFIIFWVVCVVAGGDAVNGKIENGSYYFGSHGKYTKVSKLAYIISAGYLTVFNGLVSLGMLSLFVFIIKDGITLKDFKENPTDLFIFIPLFIGLGFSVCTFHSINCILRAFELCN